MNISYDAIASDYATYRKVHPDLLQRLIELPGIKSTSRVLEMGCGTGNYVTSIAALTSHALAFSHLRECLRLLEKNIRRLVAGLRGVHSISKWQL
jgi:protein-L-isoaspartate O-methyltransferase